MNITRNRIIFGAISLIVLVSIGFIYVYGKQNGSNIDGVENGINYAPSTNVDQQLNDSVKESVAAADSQVDRSPSSPEAKNEVKPVISAWGQPGGPGTDLRINGFVPSVIETNGTCTITVTNGELSTGASKSALQNAQDTSCGQLTIAYSNLSPGTWRAILTYNSTTSAGSSDAVEIEVK